MRPFAPRPPPLTTGPWSLKDVTTLFCCSEIFGLNTMMLPKPLLESPAPLLPDLLELLQPRRILLRPRTHIMQADSCCSSSFIHHNACGNRSPGVSGKCGTVVSLWEQRVVRHSKAHKLKGPNLKRRALQVDILFSSVAVCFF